MDIVVYVASPKEGYATGKISGGELVENIDALVSEINAVKK